MMRFDPQSNFLSSAQPPDTRLPYDEVVRPVRINTAAVVAALLIVAGFGGWAGLHVWGPREADASLQTEPTPAAQPPIDAVVALEARALIDEANRAANASNVDTEEPKDASVVAYETGRELMAIGRNRDALEYLRQSVELNPQFAEARYQLAVALVLLKQRDAAKEQLAVLETLDSKRAGLLRTLVR